MAPVGVACIAWATIALGALRIHDVQGGRHVSPLAGAPVTAVEGVVTVVGPSSFYMQDDEPDDDEATSEGLRVRGSWPVVRGDRAIVDGDVRETREGCQRCTARDANYENLTTTEIVASRVTVLAHGQAPPPAQSWFAADPLVLPPMPVDEASAASDVELAAHPLQPRRSWLDRAESLEGMQVAIEVQSVAGPRVTTDGARELAVLGVRAEPVVVSGELGIALPAANRGDRMLGRIHGVVGYRAGRFVLVATQALPALHEQPPPSVVPTAVRPSDELVVATFNLQNLAPDSALDKLDGLATTIVAGLGSPDVLVVEEVQDESGALNDRTVSAAGTYRVLIDAIMRAGGPAYAFRDLPPVDGEDGGQPGANIRVGVLLRSDRAVRLIESVDSPARLAPAAAAFIDSRKPLLLELAVGRETWFVLGCHFVSQLADAPREGRFQPPVRRSRALRLAQAGLVAAFVEQLLTQQPDARVIVLGDLNDGASSPPLQRLRAAGLQDPLSASPAEQRFTHVYDGVGEDLDHVLLSASLMSRVVEARSVHGNAGRASSASDHDPVLVRLHVSELVEPRGRAPSSGCSTLPASSSSRGSSGWLCAAAALARAYLGRTKRLRRAARCGRRPSRL